MESYAIHLVKVGKDEQARAIKHDIQEFKARKKL
jgi:hypothetical protein